MAINAGDVILSHGANMGLFIALMSITNPGDNILVPEPGYPFFDKNGPVIKHFIKIYLIWRDYFHKEINVID